MRRALSLILCFLLLLPIVASVRVPAEAGEQVLRSVETTGMKIALTFDDGPHPSLTPRILEILKRYDVTATFFMVGENVIHYPDAARAVVEAGHEIGNHTQSHRLVGEMDEWGLLEELRRCEETLETHLEYRPRLFRPPQGAVTPCVLRCSQKERYRLVLWSLDTRDWENKNADEIVRAVLEKIQPGDIVLMHDYIGRKSKTPEALERLLPELLRRGFEPVTVSCLLGDEVGA